MKKRTQWVITMHFQRDHSKTLRFDSKAAALEAIRVAVFANEDCINFSCHREEYESSLLDKLDELKKLMALRDKLLNAEKFIINHT